MDNFSRDINKLVHFVDMHLFDADFALGKIAFHFWKIVWVWRLAVNIVWSLKSRNYFEIKSLFLHGLGFDGGWSDFVPSNFVFFVFNMADSLSNL